MRQEKEIKYINLRKKNTKWSLFPDDIISHIENPKESSGKLLELTDSSKFPDAKINCISVYQQKKVKE